MANAKKCDRCGAYYDNNTEHTRTVANEKRHYSGMCMLTDAGHRLDSRDLCDTCITELKLFINGRGIVKGDS